MNKSEDWSVDRKQRLDHRRRARNAAKKYRDTISDVESEDFFVGFECGFFEALIAVLEPSARDNVEKS